MKILIVYYSLEGNTQYAAEKLAGKTGADLLRLVPKKAYHDKGFAKFFWGGKSAVMAEKPELEEYSVDWTRYERVVFGTPVWASTFTPPLHTFVEENKEELMDRKISAFACEGGTGAKRAFRKLAKCLEITGFEQTAVFIEPKAKQSAETDAQIDAFGEKLKHLGKNRGAAVDPTARTIYCNTCRQPIPNTAETCPYCGCPRGKKVLFGGELTSGIEADRIETTVKNAAAGFRRVAENDRKTAEQENEAERRRAELTEQINAGNSVPFSETKCRSCWFDNPPGTVRCLQCGALLRRRDGQYLPEIKYCECGYENAPGATVCAKCHGYIKNICPECGCENLPGVTICANCNSHLAEPKKGV